MAVAFFNISILPYNTHIHDQYTKYVYQICEDALNISVAWSTHPVAISERFVNVPSESVNKEAGQVH